MDEGLPLPLTQRISPRGWEVLDVALAVFLATGSIVSIALGNHRGPNGDAWDAIRYAVTVAACAPIPLRRKYPIQVLVVVASAVAILLALGGHGPTPIALAVIIYSVAATSPRRTSLAAAAGVIAAVVVGALVASGRPEWGSVISAPPVILVGWLAGENTRTRRAYIQGMAERAAERERENSEQVRRAAAGERLRIARELHDVVAHAMSVVAVRSGVARMVMDSQPDEARRALEIIETTSRRALQEMRLLVGVLRQDDDPVSELAPAPGLADLAGLVSEIGQAGVEVDFHVEGGQRPLPPGVDVSAYRIAQEALTNVVRHAGPAKAQLSIRYRPGSVEVEVSDDGGSRRSPALATAAARRQGGPDGRGQSGGPEGRGQSGGPEGRPGPGHGLVGMRERVALFGGDVSAGPTAQGFRVLAHLPTEEAAP